MEFCKRWSLACNGVWYARRLGHNSVSYRIEFDTHWDLDVVPETLEHRMRSGTQWMVECQPMGNVLQSVHKSRGTLPHGGKAVKIVREREFD